MPFRSVSFWSGCVSNGLIGAVFASVAQATMTVNVVNSGGGQLGNVVSNIAYYPADTSTSPYADDTSSPPAYFLDAGDSVVPPVISVDLGIASSSSDRSKLVYYSVFSDKSVTPAAGGYVVLFATAQGSVGEKPIPIAFVGDATGSGALCPGISGCLMRKRISGTDYYFAYNYTANTTLVVGFYPADVCLAYASLYGGVATGCSSTTVNTNVGTGSTMQLHFNIASITANSDDGDVSKLTDMQATSAIADQYATALGLSFEKISSAPTYSCSSGAATTFLTDVYRPGDSEIIVDSNRFSSSMSGLVAPVTQVIVIGNEGNADPVVKSAFEDGTNKIHQRIDIGSGQAVGGFTNTTDGDNPKYKIAFMPRDAAGIVVTGQGGCALSDVRTSQIQGFLNKSSCFIATAAYRSNDAAPVMMLRRFRDLILMRSESGRSFVKWYYHWSPGAAEWLMEHPAFRYPVLLALVPVEIAAWCLLNPLWAGMGIFILMAAGLFWMIRRMGANAGVSHES